MYKTYNDQRFFLICIFIYLFLAISLYIQTPTTTSCLDIDSTGYDCLACHFAQTGKLVDPQNAAKAPVQTVGYPFIIGLLYTLFGHHYAIVIGLQIMCMALSIWLIALCALKIGGSNVARSAALLSALNIGFLVYPQFLLAESFLVLLIAIFFERFIDYLFYGSRVALIWASTALGFSLIIKPTALFFCVLVIGIVVIHEKKIRNKILWALVCFFCLMLPLICYMLRNKFLYGYFHIAPMMSLNMYIVFLSKVIAAVQNISVEQATTIIPPFQAENTLDERGWQAARELFYWYVYHEPFTCIMIWLQNVLKSAGGLFSTQLKLLLNPAIKGGDVSFFLYTGSLFERIINYLLAGSSQAGLVIISTLEALWSLARWLLVVGASVLLYKERRYILLILLGSFILNGLLVTGFDGCGRYRILVEPMLILLASYMLVACFTWLRYRVARPIFIYKKG